MPVVPRFLPFYPAIEVSPFSFPLPPPPLPPHTMFMPNPYYAYPFPMPFPYLPCSSPYQGLPPFYGAPSSIPMPNPYQLEFGQEVPPFHFENKRIN